MATAFGGIILRERGSSFPGQTEEKLAINKRLHLLQDISLSTNKFRVTSEHCIWISKSLAEEVLPENAGVGQVISSP